MVRRAWLRLRATPVFTAFAVVSLALGVGVTTAIYSVIVSLTRDMMAVPNAERIGLVAGTDAVDARRVTWRSVLSRADFDDLRRLESPIGPWAASASFYQTLADGTATESVAGEAVTGNYFSVLGIAPVGGRLIQPSDDKSPARIVVLSHRFWRTQFASDPGVVGRNVRIGGEPFEVVGVAAEGFGGLTSRIQTFTAVWVPLASTSMFQSAAAPPRDPTDRRRRQLTVFAPLPESGEFGPAVDAVTALGASLDKLYPIDMRRAEATAPVVQPRAWSVKSIAAVRRESESQVVWTLRMVMSIVGLVLVVACTNLANLVLARGSSRTHELAVRRALGASRVRLIIEQLAETSLLALMGAVGAFVVARILIVWFTSAKLPISAGVFVELEPRLDVPTLTLAAISVLASLVVFGLAPAIQLTRMQLRPVLSSEGGSTGHLKWRTRRTLIAVQVMISVSFFLIAAFAVRVVQAERGRPSGVDVDRLAMGFFNFQLPPWTEARARVAVDNLMTLAPSQPGLETVAVTSGMPFGGTFTPGAQVTTPEKPFGPGQNDYTFAPLISATPSIFSTLGVPIVRGRGFEARDARGSQPVAVVSELTARQLFGTTDVLGREVLWRPSHGRTEATIVESVTIVGVAGDTDTQQRQSRDAGVVYLPLAQHYEPFLALVGRTSGDPADIIPALRTLSQRADPDLALDRPGTAALTIAGLYVLLGVVSRLAGGLALLALVLGMAGLFGVLSHLVSRRTREMGLRLALGADPTDIRRLVLRDGLQPVVSGLIMGFLIAIAVRLLLRSSSPFNVSDAVVFALTPVPILLAALLACYWPARRASRVDPNIALRDL